ncbi:MAG TPA: hypothetical protein VE889_05275 [Actinomycetota bacterium]|nr:hypothetical protein [Actinomycetota bacterium]
MGTEHAEIVDPAAIRMGGPGKDPDDLVVIDRQDPQPRVEIISVDIPLKKLVERGRGEVPMILECLFENAVDDRKIMSRIEVTQPDAGRTRRRECCDATFHVPEAARENVAARDQEPGSRLVLRQGCGGQACLRGHFLHGALFHQTR